MPPDSTYTGTESTQTVAQDVEKAVGSQPQLARDEEQPDGGYGWVIVACSFMMSAVTWGANTTFGVFLSFYRKNNFFPGATDVDFAFVGGLSVSCAMAIAPLANILSKRYNFKAPLSAGVLLFVLSQIFAGLSTRIWQLFLTQGVMFGIGLGLVFIPVLPLTNQWFTRKRALAGGLFAGGSGAGALVLSLTTEVIIERHGLRWAFFTNAFISLAVLVPVVILLRSRVHTYTPTFAPLRLRLLLHPGFIPLLIWGAFSVFGYILALFTLATFSTSALGLPQSRGSALQAILAAGQMVGRPLAGLAMDRWGRLNVAVLVTLGSGVSCLAVWMVARSFGVLAFFAVVQDLSSALSLLWLSIVIPSTFAEPVAVWFLQYSQRTLHRQGADAYLISIGISGGAFVVAAVALLWAKRWKQGDWRVWVKT